MKIPGFLLRRLYVKGSLTNRVDGFRFQLKNSLGSGYAHRLLPLSVDGQELPAERTFFEADGTETPFSAASAEQPFTLAMNRTATLIAKTGPLAPGPHKIGMGFEVVGLGELRFDFQDIISES